MKKRGIIFIIIIILIIVIDILILLRTKIFKKEDDIQENTVILKNTEEIGEKKITTENKIDKVEKITGIEELEVQGLKIKKNEDENFIETIIKNTSNRIIESGPVNITLLDKEGNEVLTFVTYLDNIQANEEVPLQAASLEDLSNVVSYTISK